MAMTSNGDRYLLYKLQRLSVASEIYVNTCPCAWRKVAICVSNISPASGGLDMGPSVLPDGWGSHRLRRTSAGVPVRVSQRTQHSLAKY
eukprot:4586095-Amphidinium_carterae.1